ncbi:thymidylate synthase ThyX [Vallitalea guaymasensis]|uniref:thymidylate synthase ThyX n=1 Tax=Vallitalea guaymasensis TaxID=1185412 RepID=UPI0023522CFA|nr:thymidylate synthase ThyX [Vallitalea guaymasensis]
MRSKLLNVKGSWREVADSARTTINKEAGTKEPSSSWKRRMLLSEHSPIRQILINAKWYDLKYWVSVHFVRHKYGIEHWVRTQRTDRTGLNRNELPQGNSVEHEFLASTQAVINISRKRLCKQASKETREAWEDMLMTIKESQPELYKVCVPDCIYRGWCYEYKSCGYHKTKEYEKRLKKYREGINQ